MATITQQGKNWQAQIRRRGVRRFKTFPTKTLAKQWARRVEAEIDAGEASGKRSPGKDTLGQIIQLYVEHATRHKPMGRSKRATLAALQGGTLGAIRLADLTAARIVAFAEARAKEGAGPVTVGIDLAYLGVVVKYARTRLKLDVGPTVVQDARDELRDHALVGKSRSRDRRPTADELARLEKAWTSSLPLDLVRFAIASAMRASEITRILWADLDGATVLIRDRKDPRAKAGNDQRVPLSPEALAIIARQPRTDPRIFPYPAKSLASVHPRMCALAGVEDLHFHDYRHEATSRFFEAGLTIPEVAAITGHKDWKMLSRYTQLRPSAIAAKLAGQLPSTADPAP